MQTAPLGGGALQIGSAPHAPKPQGLGREPPEQPSEDVRFAERVRVEA